MAYIIGLETIENLDELARRGWEVEDAPESLIGEQSRKVMKANPNMRFVQFWVSVDLFDVMNGPDWDKGRDENQKAHKSNLDRPQSPL